MSPDQASADRRSDFVGGEYPFTVHDFTRLAQILRAETGIVLEEGKMPLLYARLAKRLRELGMDSFKSYCAFIATAAGADERRRMLEALTTNVTRFFRGPHHFEHLRTQVMPQLATQARRGRRVRFWSAGCSSGEEPYSIALTILSVLPEAAQLDVKVLATDIDSDVLQRGKEGVYSETALAQVNSELRRRWFGPAESQSECRRAGPELRALVAFRNSNLVGPWPMKGPFEVIFCRNTVIYFDEDVRTQIWSKMAALLSHGGHLYGANYHGMLPLQHRGQQVAFNVYSRETQKSDGLDARGGGFERQWEAK